VGNSVIAGPGNYLIAKALKLGISVIADTQVLVEWRPTASAQPDRQILALLTDPWVP
jgi:hypothetical protein